MTTKLTLTELRLMLREPMVTVSLIGFQVVLVLVLAGVFGQTPDPDFGGVAPDDHYVVGYIGVALAALGLIVVPVHIASRREAGVLRRFRASGVSAGTMVASEVLLGAVLGVVAAVVVLLVGTGAYGTQAPDDPVGVVAWFVVGLACFVAIGGALGSMLGSARSANAVGNLLFVPMFLLGGGGPPREVMTGPMQTISDVLPISHVIGGLRQSWLGQTDDVHQMWWPVLVAVVAVGVAVLRSRRLAG